VNAHTAARIDHVGLNLAQETFPFWQDMLRHLGFEIQADGEDHFDAVADPAASMLCVTATKEKCGAGYHRKRTGLGHLAVRVPSRAAVDEFVAGFLKPRDIDLLYGGAAAYDYTPGYYAVYFEDHNRIKIEVMTADADQPSETTALGSPTGTGRHETASVFVITYSDGEWRVLLLMHLRLGALTIPGGHVEKDEQRGETAAEAAVRETREEVGLDIVLLSPPAPQLPDSFPHRILPRPWWTVSGRASADSVTPGPHVHIALAAGAAAPDRESDPLWLSAAELEAREDCLPDTRMQALALLAALDRIGPPDTPDALGKALFLAMGGI